MAANSSTSKPSSTAASGFSFLGTAPSPDVFRRWGKKHGVFLHPDVGFAIATKTMGLGVYAMKPLKKGATVVSCSAHVALSPFPNLSSCTYDEGPAVKVLQRYPNVDNVTKVVLRLASELGRPHSPWRPWLECCPLMEAHLFAMTPAQEAALCGGRQAGQSQEPPAAGTAATPSAVATNNVAIQLEDLAVATKWALAQAVMAEHPDAWPEAVASHRVFCQCLAQVVSRNFHRESVPGMGGPYLLPGVDFINHSFPHANVEFTTRGGGRSRELTFDVEAARDIAQGEQILYNYGEINEARYITEFQFSNLPATDASAAGAKKKNSITFDAVRFSFPTLTYFVSAASAAAGNAPAAASDLSDRITFLHREGHLYDEGMIILSDESAAKALQAAEADEDARAAGHSYACGGVAHQFWNVLYCLSLSQEGFNDFKGKISHHWRAPRSERLAVFVKDVLRLRAEAVAAALQAVPAAFVADGQPVASQVGRLLLLVLEAERRRLAAAVEGIAPITTRAPALSQ